MEDSGKFTIKTLVKHDDVIVQETRDMVGRISKKIVETQDDQVRKALISLGWTPPGEKRLMEPQPAPVAWMYLGEPDFDGTAWRENWQVTTSRQVATFKAQPNQPVPLVPAVQPVPVSERLPGPEDCIPHPRTKLGNCCWGFGRLSTPPAGLPAAPLVGPRQWTLMYVETIEPECSHWLPAHALPLPVGEVEG